MINSKPEVSIVITCFNYGRYLKGCLQSVMAQSFQNFEVIVIDDGSTDDTPLQIKPFLSDTRVRYIRQKNSGQARAKNLGIHQAKGRFVAFLDADDKWHPQKLSKQLPLFSYSRVGVVFSKASYINEKDEDLRLNIDQLSKYLQPKQGFVLRHLLFDNFVPFSSSVVRRHLINEGFNEKIKMGIDWELWLKLSLNHEFREAPEKLLYYRVGHAGQMSKNQRERFRSTDIILNEFIKTYGCRINKRWINDALAYKYYVRAKYYSNSDFKLAVNNFFYSINMNPFFIAPWKGFIKLLVSYASFRKSNSNIV